MIARPRWLLACACALAVAAAGCSRGKDRAYARGSTVTIAYCCGGGVLTPWVAEEAASLVFLPLFVDNEDGELEGRLARIWEHSPDYREWTYHLRSDVRWHDGVPVTAHDVEFTLRLLAKAKLDGAAPSIESIAVLDDSTVSVRYTDPTHGLDWDAFYPKHLLERLDPAKIHEWEFWTHPVGNGPYRFVRYLPETMMELQANPDYYRGKPRIGRVVLKFVGKDALSELLGGNVDLIPYVTPAQIPRLAADPRFQVSHQVVTNLVHAIYWRNDHPLFRDPRVRRALTLAIDRRELLRLLEFPDNVPLVDGPFTKRQFGRREFPEPLPYDPEQARALLEAAGWHDRDGDGVRERDGRPFRFTALVTSREGVLKMAQYVQAALRRAGVRMDLHPLDQGSVQDKLKAGEFEAAFAFFGLTPARLAQDFTATGNTAATDLIHRAQVTIDPTEQDRLYRQLAEIFQAEVPATFLLPFLDTFLAHRRLHGLRKLALTDPIEHMDELWLEDRRGQ